MLRPPVKLALFIDGVNLYATVIKALGFDIDYKRLLAEFRSWGTLVRASYYTAIIEDQEYSSIRPTAIRPSPRQPRNSSMPPGGGR
jgi:uncharacterized LabA/DUF88 family protein